MIDPEAYNNGVEDYLAGVSETGNPYDPDTEPDSYTSWNDGWLDTASEDESI